MKHSFSWHCAPCFSPAKINETDTFGPGDDDEIQFDDIGDDDEDIDDVSSPPQHFLVCVNTCICIYSHVHVMGVRVQVGTQCFWSLFWVWVVLYLFGTFFFFKYKTQVCSLIGLSHMRCAPDILRIIPRVCVCLPGQALSVKSGEPNEWVCLWQFYHATAAKPGEPSVASYFSLACILLSTLLLKLRILLNKCSIHITAIVSITESENSPTMWYNQDTATSAANLLAHVRPPTRSTKALAWSIRSISDMCELWVCKSCRENIYLLKKRQRKLADMINNERKYWPIILTGRYIGRSLVWTLLRLVSVKHKLRLVSSVVSVKGKLWFIHGPDSPEFVWKAKKISNAWTTNGWRPSNMSGSLLLWLTWIQTIPLPGWGWGR